MLQDLSDKQHPYIVSLHHSFQDDAHLYLVMDFVGGGLLAWELRETAQLSSSGPFPLAVLCALALGSSPYSGDCLRSTTHA